MIDMWPTAPVLVRVPVLIPVFMSVVGIVPVGMATPRGGHDQSKNGEES